PADTSHLYLLAGSLSGLLANASTDLGHYDAAAEQIRAARSPNPRIPDRSGPARPPGVGARTSIR
ncbi:hypothetical protein, partial [Nocardia cyriacigeorgica]|uniref:hypothetical protein n=1 Tax=Nocardia cyriacigeorgica TaxID=135487 RepID=UPI001C49B503